jgi:DNA polymerase-3 subunit alpha/error-prone DNA polymerase
MVPLAVRSHFSLGWGIGDPERLCRAARQRGYTRLALTDTDGLYGLWPFLDACRRENLRPIVGAEVTEPQSPRRAVCLVENAEGYRNLCRLLTARHTTGLELWGLKPEANGNGTPPTPPYTKGGKTTARFDLQRAIAEHAKGLVVLTADTELLRALHAAGVTVAAAAPRLAASAGFEKLRRAAQALAVPLVATPASFFLEPEDFEFHRTLRAVALNSTLSRLTPGETASPDAWLAAPAEYRRRFEIAPEAVDATEALAERCAFTGPDTTTVFPEWVDPSGRPAPAALRELAYAGARARYGQDLPETIVERLEHELRLIETKGFSDYFLVVREIVQRSPRTCGRGSGAASIVAYCLGITNICPVKHNLYFERFLNPGRKDPPDIDVDFAWDERDGVLASVLTRYAGHAAMVCNHVLFQPRMILREVAKVFGLPEGEIQRTLDSLPLFLREDQGDADLEEQMALLPPPREEDFPPPWPEILRHAGALAGIPRYLSVHPGGVVITPRPLSDLAPLEGAAKGVAILQWEKDGTEEAGLVKIDLLGNRSLAVIRDALHNLRANGAALDERRWEPEDDPDTQAAVAAGRTMGCFYIESPAMRLLQRKTGRGDFEHLVIHSSIIRPAANEYIREYVKRLRGARWEPLHPLLTGVLAETYGVMVYQEHVSLSAIALAGFSHEEADRLRKIISKKDRERRLPDFKERFAAGARTRGVPEETIEAVWRMMMSFAGYSFCKPHSASYARVSFQAAYLKVHHPAEFMAAVIANQGGFYSTFAYVSEAQRLGLNIRPPDVNLSHERWTGNSGNSGDTILSSRLPGNSMVSSELPPCGALRVGLQAVKGLSETARLRIAAFREGREPEAPAPGVRPGTAEDYRPLDLARPYASLRDFLERAQPDEEEARALILCGACDGLHPGRDRASLLWELAAWRHRRGRKRGQIPSPSLFDDAGNSGDTILFPRLPKNSMVSPELPPDLPPGTEIERLRQEFSVLGFLCDRHPMALYAETLAKLRPVKARELHCHAGRRVRCAGLLITGKVVSTREGEPMEFLTFEDESGTLEATFFPETYRRYWHLLHSPGPFVLAGLVEEDFGAVTLTVERLEKLGKST